jgi:hypothetical protein
VHHRVRIMSSDLATDFSLGILISPLLLPTTPDLTDWKHILRLSARPTVAAHSAE